MGKQLKEVENTIEFIFNEEQWDSGKIIELSGGNTEELAKLLGLSDDWKLKKVGNCYAAYCGDTDELKFFENKNDYEPNEE